MDEVERLGATRVVIDSLSGFEVALAPAFREDFRESLYRLVGVLTTAGVTVVMTAETSAAASTGATLERVSFITDDIIVQRYVEIAGELRPVLAVVKMRGSQHSRDYRAYEITARGAVVGNASTTTTASRWACRTGSACSAIRAIPDSRIARDRFSTS